MVVAYGLLGRVVLGRVGVDGVYLEDGSGLLSVLMGYIWRMGAGSRQTERDRADVALSGDKMNAMEVQIKRD